MTFLPETFGGRPSGVGNTPEAVERLLSWGVDAITSDVPTRAKQWVSIFARNLACLLSNLAISQVRQEAGARSAMGIPAVETPRRGVSTDCLQFCYAKPDREPPDRLACII